MARKAVETKAPKPRRSVVTATHLLVLAKFAWQKDTTIVDGKNPNNPHGLVGVAGVASGLSTFEQHLRKTALDAARGIRKKERQKPAAEQAGVGTAEPEEELVADDEQEMLEQWLEEMRPRLQHDQKMLAIMERALSRRQPWEDLVEQGLRSLNTFERLPNDHFGVFDKHFYGAWKAAAEATLNLYEDQKPKMVRGGIVRIYPRAIDLGVSESDEIKEANVTLGHTRPNEPKSSIKNFGIVFPRNPEFFLVIEILNSAHPLSQLVVRQLPALLKQFGKTGVLGSRPPYGLFEYHSHKFVTQETADAVLTGRMKPEDAPSIAVKVSEVSEGEGEEKGNGSSNE